MAFDDLEPKTKKPVLADLSLMSIGDLTTRIVEFETEIARMKRTIKDKENQRGVADMLFKKG